MSDVNLTIKDSCPCGAELNISGYSSDRIDSIHRYWRSDHAAHRGAEIERLTLQLDAEKRINAAVQETIASIVGALSRQVER
jgi:hypothetical protein